MTVRLAATCSPTSLEKERCECKDTLLCMAKIFMLLVAWDYELNNEFI
jgi:hypothetical protein